MYSEYKQYPFRSKINPKIVWGEEQPYLSKQFSFMYATQCVPFDGCKLTIPIQTENGPSLRHISTLPNPIAQRTCRNFLSDVALIFN